MLAYFWNIKCLVIHVHQNISLIFCCLLCFTLKLVMLWISWFDVKNQNKNWCLPGSIKPDEVGDLFPLKKWFQWICPTSTLKVCFNRPVSLWKLAFIFTNNKTFSCICTRTELPFYCIWSIQGLIFNISFQTCWLHLFKDLWAVHLFY